VKTKVLVVLSAPRSGSSLLTSMISKFGVNLGNVWELKKGSIHNKYGYFENREILEINEAILAGSQNDVTTQTLRTIGISSLEVNKATKNWNWCTHYKPISKDIQLPIEIARRMENVARTFDTGTSLPVWKDARFCITLPAWLRFIDPMCIIIWRSPDETATSIRKMLAIPYAQGIDLWFNYTRSAIEVARPFPHLVVSHADILRKPHHIANLIARFIGKRATRITDDMIDEAANVLDTQQHRQRAAETPNSSENDSKDIKQLTACFSDENRPLPDSIVPTLPIEYLPMIGAIRYLKNRNLIRILGLLTRLPGYNLTRNIYHKIIYQLEFKISGPVKRKSRPK